jgi:hypothetical protein
MAATLVGRRANSAVSQGRCLVPYFLSASSRPRTWAAVATSDRFAYIFRKGEGRRTNLAHRIDIHLTFDHHVRNRPGLCKPPGFGTGQSDGAGQWDDSGARTESNAVPRESGLSAAVS